MHQGKRLEVWDLAHRTRNTKLTVVSVRGRAWQNVSVWQLGAKRGWTDSWRGGGEDCHITVSLTEMEKCTWKLLLKVFVEIQMHSYAFRLTQVVEKQQKGNKKPWKENLMCYDISWPSPGHLLICNAMYNTGFKNKKGNYLGFLYSSSTLKTNCNKTISPCRKSSLVSFFGVFCLCQAFTIKCTNLFWTLSSCLFHIIGSVYAYTRTL